MTHQRRVQWPGAIYLVSNRCIEGQAFFRPTPAVNRSIERNLAWCADKYSIRIHGFMFGLSGFEMVVGAPELNLGKFMCTFQSAIAKEVKAIIGRTERGFFAGTYDSEPLLDAESVRAELARMMCSPCESGFVEHPRDWPGVCSWTLHQTGGALVRHREDRQVFWRLKQTYPEMSDAEASRRATTTYRLSLASLPVPAHEGTHLTPRQLIDRRLRSESMRTGDCHGGDRVRRWPIGRKPPSARPSRGRVCVAASPGRRAAYRKYVDDSNFSYDLARASLRRGKPNPKFPYGMIPLHKSRPVGAPADEETRAVTPKILERFSPGLPRRALAA